MKFRFEDVQATAEHLLEHAAKQLRKSPQILEIRVKTWGSISADAAGDVFFVDAVIAVKTSTVESYVNTKIPVDSTTREA